VYLGGVNANKFAIRCTLDSIERFDMKFKGDSTCIDERGRRADNSVREARGNRFGSRGIVRMCIKIGSVESTGKEWRGVMIRDTIRGSKTVSFVSTG
jgi:hypothetical protein